MMKKIGKNLVLLVTAGFLALLPWEVQGRDLPVRDGEKVVAKVGDQVITLEEFNREIGSVHEKAGEMAEEKGLSPSSQGMVDFGEVLDRMITLRLMLLEAKNIGIYDLPEVQKEVDTYARERLLSHLVTGKLKNVEADPELIEKIYRSEAREFKLKSLHFNTREEADEALAKIEEAGDVAAIGSELIAEGQAEGELEGGFVEKSEILPTVMQALSRMDPGDISSVVRTPKSWAVFQLEETRVPEERNEEIWQKAQEQARVQERSRVADEYVQSLFDRYVTLDEKLLESLDFEAEEPGFDVLAKDERTLAVIDGEQTITVLDLAELFKEHFFHGIEQAIESKSINSKKFKLLNDHIAQEVLRREALRQGIQESEAYRFDVKSKERSVVFGKMIEMVIAPSVNVTVGDVRKEYQENLEEFTFPDMLRLRNIVFSEKKFARTAIEKFQEGTDFKWLQANAEGRVVEPEEEILQLNGRLLSRSGLREGISEALEDVKAGHAALYEDSKGFHHLILLEEVIAGEPKDIKEVQGDITKRIFNRRLVAAIEDYAAKLRDHYEVVIYDPALK